MSFALVPSQVFPFLPACLPQELITGERGGKHVAGQLCLKQVETCSLETLCRLYNQVGAVGCPTCCT